MIKYNFTRIFKARGIDDPMSFLNSYGFSRNFSYRMKRNQVLRMNPGDLERVCVALHCTPNDLMEWIPDKNSNVGADHPLNQIKKTEKIIDINRTLNTVPIQQLDKLEEIIDKAVKELTGKEKVKLEEKKIVE